MPVLAGGLGDADEVAAEIDAGHTLDPEHARGERREPLGLGGVGELRHALAHHRLARQELQGGGIRGLLGLDEHRTLLRCRAQTGSGLQDVDDLFELGPHAQQQEALSR